jgi:hypothetical protein
MRFVNDVVISNVLANASLNGPAIDASYLCNCSVISVVGTGTATGTLTLEASNDIVLAGHAPINWVTIAGATVPVTAGAANYIIPYTNVCYCWLRVVYTDTSGGTGTARQTTIFNAKGF